MNGMTTLWQLVGWTMLHFLWVGGAIGILAAIARRAIRSASPEVRHAAAVLSLALLVLAPGAIAWRLNHAGRKERPFAGTGRAPGADSAVAYQAVEESIRPARPDDGLAPIPLAGAPSVGIGHELTPRRPALAARLDALAPWLPWIWLAGSPLTFAWLALGLAGAERLRQRSVVLADGDLPQTCRRLAQALGIARIVAVAVCDRIAAPVLVGIVRPLILVPATALGCWSLEQLEMVLLHELAHVRRWDNLINLVQRLVESVLFFQPAVWLVSAWLRQEREHCCDRIVVSHTGRARAYAETLLALAVPDPDRTPCAAVAMTRNHLVVRIRQILDLNPEGTAMKLPRGLIVLTAALLIVPAGFTISRAHLADAQAETEPKGQGHEIDSRALIAKAIELAGAAGKPRGFKNDNFRTLLDIGTSLGQRDDRPGAVVALHKAGELIKAMPEGRHRSEAARMLAERLALAGEADEAIALASVLEEDRSRALYLITFYLASSGNLAKAIEAAGRIQDNGQLGYALLTIAVTQARQGDTVTAIQTVESIAAPGARIRSLVGDLWSREHPGLAVACARAGDQAGSQKCLEQARNLVAALADDTKKVEAQASIALALAQLGDVAAALRQVRALAHRRRAKRRWVRSR